jgi:hypothetical protein
MFLCLCLVVIVAAGFTIYEGRVDGSIAASLWQLLRGNQVEYAGLKITLPRYWIAVHSADKLLLIHMVDHNTTRVGFLRLPHWDRSKWEQRRLLWVEGTLVDYEEKGFKPAFPPSMVVLGESPTCLEAVSKDKGEVDIQCGIAEGRVLVTYWGTENDIPYFVSMVGSIEPSERDSAP